MINYWGYPGGYPGTGPYGAYGGTWMWGAYVTYGTLALTVSSPPQSFVEPISLAEAQDFLKVPARSPSEPAEDALIQGLISAARSYAEREQGRDLVRKRWDLVFDYWMSYRIELPPVPLVSVDLMQYKDSHETVTAMVEGTDYIVDAQKAPACVMTPYNTMWPIFTPWPSSAILIRFSSGLSADDPYWLGDGQVVKAGMRYLISQWYNLRLLGGAPASEWPYTAAATLGFGRRERIY
jgi:uncharacterized phiE125 gp8 family phage protein